MQMKKQYLLTKGGDPNEPMENEDEPVLVFLRNLPVARSSWNIYPCSSGEYSYVVFNTGSQEYSEEEQHLLTYSEQSGELITDINFGPYSTRSVIHISQSEEDPVALVENLFGTIERCNLRTQDIRVLYTPARRRNTLIDSIGNGYLLITERVEYIVPEDANRIISKVLYRYHDDILEEICRLDNGLN
jgi:hypothetical protein